jgi:type IV pilus assembly protein PilX
MSYACNRPYFARAPRHRQRGIIMFIALIVMVALSLAAVALIRSVDTTTTVLGNLAFRLASVQPANAAVESAAAALFQEQDINHAIRIPDLTVNFAAENYYAFRQAEAPTLGIPAVLASKTAMAGLTQVVPVDASTGNTIQYVIERMCVAAGTATAANCDLMTPKVNSGDTIGDSNIKVAPTIPFYRVTIRVDGPQRTTSFLQAMLR